MNFSLDRIPPRYRDAYRRPGQQDRDLVRLECRSCHRPDGEGDPDARARGATMQPVRYEQHCAACHRLTYDPQAPPDPETGPPTVPHGLQPGALREYLERLYTTRLVTGPDGKLFDQPRPELPLPGRLPHTEKARTAREEVRRKVEIAERLLYLGKRACGECHVARGKEWPLGAVPGVIAGLEFEPPSVPRVWFHSAKFDHAAHRAVACRECHPGAYAMTDNGTWNEKGSRRHTDVLVPDRGTCLQCHSPARTVDGSPRGGARFDCTECHLYHHADRSLRGEDAWRRTGNPAQGIDDLLRWPQRLSR